MELPLTLPIRPCQLDVADAMLPISTSFAVPSMIRARIHPVSSGRCAARPRQWASGERDHACAIDWNFPGPRLGGLAGAPRLLARLGPGRRALRLDHARRGRSAPGPSLFLLVSALSPLPGGPPPGGGPGAKASLGGSAFPGTDRQSAKRGTLRGHGRGPGARGPVGAGVPVLRPDAGGLGWRCRRRGPDARPGGLPRQSGPGRPGPGRPAHGDHPAPAPGRRPGGHLPVPAGADRAHRRHGCLQPLRLLRAAVPALPAGAPAGPAPHAAHRRHLRAVLRPHVLRLHGRLAGPVPGHGQPALGHGRRRRAGGSDGGHQREGFLRLQGGREPVHPGIPQDRHLPPRARDPRRRQPARHAGRHRAAGRGRQFLRTAVHRRLPHGLHPGAHHAGRQSGRASALSGPLQRDLYPAPAAHRPGLRAHPGRPQAQRAGRAPAGSVRVNE
jgi:hypothetical protein